MPWSSGIKQQILRNRTDGARVHIYHRCQDQLSVECDNMEPARSPLSANCGSLTASGVFKGDTGTLWYFPPWRRRRPHERRRCPGVLEAISVHDSVNFSGRRHNSWHCNYFIKYNTCHQDLHRASSVIIRQSRFEAWGRPWFLRRIMRLNTSRY